MFFWFIGLSLWAVWFVFHDPAIDLRVVALGAVLPSITRASFLYTPLHSVLVAFSFLCLVMLLTIKKRILRRRFIFLAFGIMLNIVFDGAWSNTGVFWWPLASTHLVSNLHPTRGGGELMAMEVFGFVLTALFAFRFAIFENFGYFVRTGRLKIVVETPIAMRPTQGIRRR